MDDYTWFFGFGMFVIGAIVGRITMAIQYEVMKTIIAEDTSYGKKDFVRIGIPCDFEDLCFVAAEDPAELEGNEAASIYPRAQDVAESPDNVFLANLDGSIDSFLVDRFEIEGGLPIACIRQQSGELKFRVEGKGDMAVIVPVS